MDLDNSSEEVAQQMSSSEDICRGPTVEHEQVEKEDLEKVAKEELETGVSFQVHGDIATLSIAVYEVGSEKRVFLCGRLAAKMNKMVIRVLDFIDEESSSQRTEFGSFESTRFEKISQTRFRVISDGTEPVVYCVQNPDDLTKWLKLFNEQVIPFAKRVRTNMQLCEQKKLRDTDAKYDVKRTAVKPLGRAFQVHAFHDQESFSVHFPVSVWFLPFIYVRQLVLIVILAGLWYVYCVLRVLRVGTIVITSIPLRVLEAIQTTLRSMCCIALMVLGCYIYPLQWLIEKLSKTLRLEE